ncbi:uncharacterized protein [Eurosta solidaginis]|uniref:uncharacterized protein n=1 Tax=Eurosta solidaginis TaxID=178769 RepID=UPI0035307B42
MDKQCVLIMVLLLAFSYSYVACNAKSIASISYQADQPMDFKSHQPHKRYQNDERNDYNTLEGKAMNDDSDIFDDLQPDIYDNLVRIIREMQKDRARIAIRYRPNLGKRAKSF